MGDCGTTCKSIKNNRLTNVLFNIKQFFPRLVYSIRYRILRFSINYIKAYAIRNNSNYIKHATEEFDIAFNTVWKHEDNDPYDDCMQRHMCNQLLELLSLLNVQGDSGSSINYKLSMFTKLAKFGTIAPLTFADDEFNDSHSLDGSAQNKRNSAVFKENGKFTYNHAISKRPTYYCGEDAVVTKNVKSYCMSGGGFVVYPDRSIYYISNMGIIKDTKTFNAQRFEIPAYEIEYPNGWWLTLIKREDLDASMEVYDFKEVPAQEQLDKELDFKEGIHRQAILDRIDLIVAHMYPQN